MNKGYVDNINMDLDFVGVIHDARSKIKLGTKLTLRERSHYLLFAPIKEAEEYLKNEKEGKKD